MDRPDVFALGQDYVLHVGRGSLADLLKNHKNQ